MKKSPSILLCVNLVSERRAEREFLLRPALPEQLAALKVKDALARVEGVGDVQLPRPPRLQHAHLARPAAAGLLANDRRRRDRRHPGAERAGRGRPARPAARAPARPRCPSSWSSRPRDGSATRAAVRGHHRQDGRRTARSSTCGTWSARTSAKKPAAPPRRASSWGPRTTTSTATSTTSPSVTLAVFQLPGSNALTTADGHPGGNEEARDKGVFPEGVEYKIVYDTTVFVDESIHEVYKTLFEAFILVFIVVLVFLQDWRATLMPMIDVPVSLDRHLRRHGLAGLLLEQPDRSSDWCWPSASSSTTPSSWWRTSNAGWPRGCRRARPPSRPWTKSPDRSSPSPWCSARSSSPRRSWPASAASSTGSSP